MKHNLSRPVTLDIACQLGRAADKRSPRGDASMPNADVSAKLAASWLAEHRRHRGAPAQHPFADPDRDAEIYKKAINDGRPPEQGHP